MNIKNLIAKAIVQPGDSLGNNSLRKVYNIVLEQTALNEYVSSSLLEVYKNRNKGRYIPKKGLLDEDVESLKNEKLESGVTILEEITSNALDAIALDFVRKKNLQEVMKPTITFQLESGKDNIYKMEFDTMPYIEDIDPKELTADFIEYKPSKEEIEKFLKSELENEKHAVEKSADASSAVGDRLKITYSAWVRRAKKSDGAEVSNDLGKYKIKFQTDKKVVLEIDDSNKNSQSVGSIVDQLSSKLIGLKKGETKEVIVNIESKKSGGTNGAFPAKALITVDAIEKMVSAENMEAYMQFKGIENQEALDNFASKVLEQKYRDKIAAVNQKSMLEALSSAATFEVPESLVSVELDRQTKDLSKEIDPEQKGLLKVKIEKDIKTFLLLDQIKASFSKNPGDMDFLETALPILQRMTEMGVNVPQTMDVKNERFLASLMNKMALEFIAKKMKRNKKLLSAEELERLEIEETDTQFIASQSV